MVVELLVVLVAGWLAVWYGMVFDQVPSTSLIPESTELSFKSETLLPAPHPPTPA